jgi:hypothetical protein
MNNEPVARALIKNGIPASWMWNPEWVKQNPNGEFTLYVHSAKTLTDEEIEEVFYSLEVGHSSTDFARAILRKAQKK